MTKISGATGVAVLLLTACSEQPPMIEPEQKPVSLQVAGNWIKGGNDEVMTDPQTSGLTVFEDKLVTLSDASANAELQRRLHFINPESSTVESESEKMRLGTVVRRSCFAGYLADEPDLEALVADPIQPGVFYTVTEDATRTGALSTRCQKRYQNSGSTDYPSLLVRLEQNEFGTTMTGVRPLQFAIELGVGDYPNDGIEGLAIGPNNQLYLGLEKDANGQPRVFSLALTDAFWKSTDYAPVSDPGLNLPQFDSGNHPVNGMTYYTTDSGDGYLLAAARNDNELWVISTAADKAAKRVPLNFIAPADNSVEGCEVTEIMDNASIEGIAVLADTLWMINDPWKENYLKNIRCESNRENYESMAPLLFSTPINPQWFE